MIGLGGIIGDMSGQPYEFVFPPIKTTDFLFLEPTINLFTDDTVMQLAVAAAILRDVDADFDTMTKNLQEIMQTYGRRYPDVGYGFNFYQWILSQTPSPYQSFGNGCVMRCVLIPWIYQNDLGRCLEVAELQTNITHNHPESVKAAKCITHTMWLLLNGYSKDDVEQIVKDNYYPLDHDYEYLKAHATFDVSCQGCCPIALTAFFQADNFEDIVRLSIAIGGDTDTLACIAGALAEACYGSPFQYQRIALQILPDDLSSIVYQLNEYVINTHMNFKGDTYV